MTDSSIATTLFNTLLAPPPSSPISRITEYLSADPSWSLYVGFGVAGLAMLILGVLNDIRKKLSAPPLKPVHRQGFKNITGMPIDREQKP